MQEKNIVPIQIDIVKRTVLTLIFSCEVVIIISILSGQFYIKVCFLGIGMPCPIINEWAFIVEGISLSILSILLVIYVILDIFYPTPEEYLLSNSFWIIFFFMLVIIFALSIVSVFHIFSEILLYLA
ncbi:MAG: hypothetical protein ACFE9N_16650 [Promethearchaeota archaeon]